MTRPNDTKPGVVHVLDTSIWIELLKAAKLGDALPAIMEALEEGTLTVGLPEVVESELSHPDRAEEVRAKEQQRRLEHIRLARTVARDVGGASREAVTNALDALANEVRKLDESHAGRLQTLTSILGHDQVLRIETSSSAKTRTAEQGLQKLAPFSAGRNSTADALILFSIVEWAAQRPQCRVVFHTLNYKDFSDSQHHATPHPDIAPLFTQSLQYSFGIEPLMNLVTSSLELLRLARDVDRRAGECLLCEERTLISEVACSECGEISYDVPDHEGYYIEPGERGERVFEVVEDPRGRSAAESTPLECSSCGRCEFEVSYNAYCSYHQWQIDKDD